MRKPTTVLMRVAAAKIGLFLAGVVHAAPIVQPLGLNPGDTYRLVFVTSGTRNATSSNISDYDSFVTTQANLNSILQALGTTWQAIGSTASVNAFNHIGGTFTIPIYNLNGQLVATGSNDLWDGSLGAAIQYDQAGNALNTSVWTGTLANGQSGSPNVLGSTTPIFGVSSNPTGSWTNATVGLGTSPMSLYAISATLTVPQAVPEPDTTGFLALSLLAIWWRRARS